MSILRLLVVLTSTALAAAPVADPIRLAPGSALLRLDRITPSVDSTFIHWSMNGQERAGPIQIESVRRITRDGRAVLEHRIEVAGSRMGLTDTTWHDARSLAPIAHRSFGTGRAFRLDYDEARVRGSHWDSTGTHPIEASLGEPVFDPSALHLVLRSLVLAPGQRYLIPFFNHEAQAVRTDTLIVEAEDRVDTEAGPVPVWRTVVAMSGRRAIYYLSQADGRELKVIVAVGGGEMRIVRRGVK